MKTALAVALAVVLLAVALGLGWTLHSANAALARHEQTIAAQRQQIETIKTALADKSKPDSLAQEKPKQDGLAIQGECATQAEKAFVQLGYSHAGNNLGVGILQSHFSPRLDRCFMAVEAYNRESGVITRALLDAYEQREYASYVWVSDKIKYNVDVNLLVCKEVPVSGPERPCHSDEEYKAIVKRYME